MTFTQAIAVCLSRYADFTGRAGRPEFWWFFLFQVIVLIVTSLLHPYVYLLAALALLLPSLSATVRRLHDTGRSGWWVLLGLVPLVNLVLIYFAVLAGQPQSNEHGEPV